MTRRCWSSWPGRASARATGWRSLATIQEKTSVAAATEPTPAASRAAGRRRFGARAERALPTAVVASSGPIMWEPQRSCSRVRGEPCS